MIDISIHLNTHPFSVETNSQQNVNWLTINTEGNQRITFFCSSIEAMENLKTALEACKPQV